MRVPKAIAVILTLAVCGAAAECPPDEQVRLLAQHYFDKKPVVNVPVVTAPDAACARAKYNAVLAQRLGPPIGYKVGLTHVSIQRAMKADGPAWGVLYPGTLLPSGTQMNVGFGAQPTVEADLLVRVRSADIHTARTPDEVLRSLDQVIPFIELPDLMLAEPLWLNVNIKMAFNLSARHGVAGTPVPVPPDEAGRAAMLQALGTMKLRASDGNGKTLGESTGADLLGHPMNAALWLVQALTKEGIALRPGHYLSLGSFPPVMRPRAGLKFVVDYQGLPGAEPVWVQFIP